jgi:hypothetical protein
MAWDAKYNYTRCNGVKDANGNRNPCFAYMHYRNEDYLVKYETFFELESVMSVEDATKWLKILQKEIEFKWEHKGGSTFRIYWPRHDWKFTVMFGNLCKGISEFAFFCERHLQDESDDPFFIKNLRAFQTCSKQDLMEVQYNSNHGWWQNSHCQTSPQLSATTLKELINRIPKHEANDVWPFCLEGRTE